MVENTIFLNESAVSAGKFKHFSQQEKNIISTAVALHPIPAGLWVGPAGTVNSFSF
jgi:hypothetical protein